jgi:uncharacterized phage protein (TIGR02218 family)
MVRSVIGATSLSYNYDSEIEEAATDRCYCLKIKRKDGTIFAFTENSEKIAFDLTDGDGEVEYLPTDSVELAGDLLHRTGMAVDSDEIKGIISSDQIDDDDIRAGLFDHAEVTLFSVIFSDLTLGARIHRSGWLGEIMLSDGIYKAELRSLRQAYSQRIVEVFTPFCRANLGDSRCGVDLNPSFWTPNTAVTAAGSLSACTLAAEEAGNYDIGDLGNSTVLKPTTPNGYWFSPTKSGLTGSVEPTWDTSAIGAITTDNNGITYQAIPEFVTTGTITAVNSRKRFDVDVTLSYAEFGNLYKNGIITFTSGENAGTSWEITGDQIAARGEIILYMPTGKDPSVGDAFTLTMGCVKSMAYCFDRFRNTLNFRGEPYVPGTDVQLRYADGN